MKKISIIISIFSLLALPIFAQSNNTRINWLSIEEAEEKSKTSPKKIIIDVYTDWCGWCKKMDRDTFANPIIAGYVNENYYAVKLNAEQRSSISFKGKDYNYVAQGRGGYNELAGLLLNGNMSYPSIVFLDENMNSIQPIPGYQTPQSLDKILKYLAGNHHQTTEWKKFEEQIYVSPF